MFSAGRVGQLRSAFQHTQAESEFLGPSTLGPENDLVLLLQGPADMARRANKGKSEVFFSQESRRRAEDVRAKDENSVLQAHVGTKERDEELNPRRKPDWVRAKTEVGYSEEAPIRSYPASSSNISKSRISYPWIEKWFKMERSYGKMKRPAFCNPDVNLGAANPLWLPRWDKRGSSQAGEQRRRDANARPPAPGPHGTDTSLRVGTKHHRWGRTAEKGVLQGF